MKTLKYLKKGIEEDTRKREKKLSMLIGYKNQYCEMAIFPEALYRLNTTSIKTPMPFSQKQKKIVKLIWKQRNPMKPMNHHT